MLSSDQMVGQHYSDAFKSLPQVGLVPLLDQAYLEHLHGTMVNETIECTIPGRSGTVSLNCYVCSLRDTQDRYIGMALVIDDQTSTVGRLLGLSHNDLFLTKTTAHKSQA